MKKLILLACLPFMSNALEYEGAIIAMTEKVEEGVSKTDGDPLIGIELGVESEVGLFAEFEWEDFSEEEVEFTVGYGQNITKQTYFEVSAKHEVVFGDSEENETKFEGLVGHEYVVYHLYNSTEFGIELSEDETVYSLEHNILLDDLTLMVGVGKVSEDGEDDYRYWETGVAVEVDDFDIWATYTGNDINDCDDCDNVFMVGVGWNFL